MRHRGRARVEDSIRAAKETGMRNLPHYAFEHNQTWLEISLIAQDLLCWTKLICLEGELTKAEPKRLRHLLLHTAGVLITHARRAHLKLDRDRPWSQTLVAAFDRLRTIPALCRALAALAATVRDNDRSIPPRPACPESDAAHAIE
jgi:hypothetical protein